MKWFPMISKTMKSVSGSDPRQYVPIFPFMRNHRNLSGEGLQMQKASGMDGVCYFGDLELGVRVSLRKARSRAPGY